MAHRQLSSGLRLVLQLGLLFLCLALRLPAVAQAPVLLPSTALRNAPAVAPAGPLSLTFSSPVDPRTVGAITLTGSQGQGRRPLSPTVTGSTVTLAFSGRLLPGEPASVTVPAAVQDPTGLSVAAQVLQFTAAVRGPGRGLFTAGTDIGQEFTSSSQALGDVDGDGDLDLVVPQGSNFGPVSRVVAVYRNDGQGAFPSSATVSVGTGGAPFAVALADVDGDGDLDLLAACSPGQAVSLRLNDGRGNFSGGTEIPVQVTAFYLLLGDVDADGDQDLIVHTNTAGQTVASIRLNQGNGTFAGGSEVAVAGGTGALTLGDVDSDGDMDLLTTGFTTGQVYTCLNQGNGTFGRPSSFLMGNAPASLALADVDGDGDLDLVVGCAGTNTVETRLNNGQGQFAALGASVAVGNYPQQLRLTDVDSDGDLDLLSGNMMGGSVSVRLNTAGRFGGGSDVALGKLTYGLAVGDLDGDEDMDFLTCAVDTRAQLRIGLNQAPPCSSGDPGANAAPVLVSTAEQPLVVRPGQLVLFTLTGHDPDNDPMTLTLRGQGFSVEEVGASMPTLHTTRLIRGSFTWTVPCRPAGPDQYTFEFTLASTGYGREQTTRLVIPFAWTGAMAHPC
ncbi:FG-GAP-like repeat-containing protein [Hymenobacter sp. HD11105]